MTEGESRIVYSTSYPKMVYIESLLIFFGANFLFHQNVFRASQNRLQFLGFLAVNAFTSYQLAETLNHSVIRYYTAGYNNTMEMNHRAELNARLRLKLFGRKQQPQV